MFFKRSVFFKIIVGVLFAIVIIGGVYCFIKNMQEDDAKNINDVGFSTLWQEQIESVTIYSSTSTDKVVFHDEMMEQKILNILQDLEFTEKLAQDKPPFLGIPIDVEIKTEKQVYEFGVIDSVFVVKGG